MSDDGRYGLTLILMIGSVFSPYYRKAIRNGVGNPLRHSAVNLALYDMERPFGSWLGPVLKRRHGDLWALTEGGRLVRDRKNLHIGDSNAHWNGTELSIVIREKTAPFESPLSGEMVITPSGVAGETHILDGHGKHRWSPIAPFGRIDVRFREPNLRFSGVAYLDHNAGDEPLSKGFKSWTWSRFSSDQKTIVSYDVQREDGSHDHIARAFHSNGLRDSLANTGALKQLNGTSWRMNRNIRTIQGARVELGRTLEDTPFYARSHLTGTLDDRPASGVHEVVDTARFESLIVQNMLPYRMRRVAA